jgi:starch phosphorylase
VFAGKAHPYDEPGKHLIQQIVRAQDAIRPEVNIVYLENYDWNLAWLLTSGVDVWLNTPQPPLEASGTSGMKAALNGVPSLSVLDGWWMEGCIEDVTGWAIGDHDANLSPIDRTQSDAAAFYDKLERVVLPCFYQQRDQFIRTMRQAIALNASHFNTQRMVQEYVAKAYFQ